MKWVIAAFLAVLAVMTFVTSFVSAQLEQQTELQTAGSSIGTPFEIPASPQLNDPGSTLPALKSAANSAHVNIIRTETGYTAHKEPETVQYIYATGPSGLYANIPLSSGRPLTPAETAGTTSFLSSASSASSDQRGTIRVFGGGTLVQVRPLAAAFTALPVTGVYYVEASSPAAYSTFLARFAAQINQRGQTHVTQKSFESSSEAGGESSASTRYLLLAITYVILVLVLILLAYRQLYETKRIGVMALHGYPTASIWWRLSGRLILTTLGVSSVVLTIAGFFVPGATVAFPLSLIGSFATWLIATLLVSLLTGLYISSIKLSNALKNRKDTRVLFVVNTMLKALCTIALLITGSGLAVEYATASHERAALGNWEATRDFGIFYPTTVGRDLSEIEAGLPGPTTAEVFDLYPKLDRAGAIYIDASEYLPQALKEARQGETIPALQVNPNYLDTYPVKDAAGNPIHVAESDTNWVLLVPETERSRASQIERYFQQLRTGGHGFQSTAQAEESAFGRTLPVAVANQKVQVIWTEPHQHIFTFNPNFAAGRGNTVDDPIVQVMTLSNSAGVDRENMITGSPDEALKVRLTDGSSARTLTVLQPTLRDLKLDDNLPYLVTMNQYVISQVAYLDQGIRLIMLTAAALALGLLALIVQGLSVAFERFSRRIVVRSLFGLSFWQKYREPLLITAGMWAIQVAAALAGNAAGLSPLSTSTTSSVSPALVILEVAAIVMAVELALSAAVLLRFERRRTTTVLKGEF